MRWSTLKELNPARAWPILNHATITCEDPRSHGVFHERSPPVPARPTLKKLPEALREQIFLPKEISKDQSLWAFLLHEAILRFVVQSFFRKKFRQISDYYLQRLNGGYYSCRADEKFAAAILKGFQAEIHFAPARVRW